MRTAAVHGRWSAGGSGPRGQVQRMRWMYGAVQILLSRKPCCMPGLPWGAKALPAAQRPWKADSCLEGASLQCTGVPRVRPGRDGRRALHGGLLRLRAHPTAVMLSLGYIKNI